MPRMIICPRCQRERPHYGKGHCKGCYCTLYNQAHPERHAEHERNRRQNTPEIVRLQDKKRSETEKRRAWRRRYHQKYYAEHRSQLLEYQSNYRRNNPERRDHYKRRRRARVKGLPDTLTLAQWEQILTVYEYSCAYCGISNVPLEREHKTPASRGGGFTAENIIPACGECNRRKQTMTDEEFRTYLIQYPR